MLPFPSHILTTIGRYLIEIGKLDSLIGVSHEGWRKEGLRLISSGGTTEEETSATATAEESKSDSDVDRKP